MNYTPEQIKIAKRLVNWLISLGIQEPIARKEVVGILKRYTTKKINSAMTQTNCTSLKNLKSILVK